MRIVILLIASSLSSGCVYTKYTGKDGISLSRISVFGNQTVGKVDLVKGTISGYSSEQSEAAAAMAEGIAAGIAKATLKP